ncbi:hypothetical protein LINPERHAP1_LOCUS17207 [Linum perenne]
MRVLLLRDGAYLLSKLQGSLDHKIYHTNCYFISGHSLEHLCLAAAPVLLTAMLIRRNVKFQRHADADADALHMQHCCTKERPFVPHVDMEHGMMIDEYAYSCD